MGQVVDPQRLVFTCAVAFLGIVWLHRAAVDRSAKEAFDHLTGRPGGRQPSPAEQQATGAARRAGPYFRGAAVVAVGVPFVLRLMGDPSSSPFSGSTFYDSATTTIALTMFGGAMAMPTAWVGGCHAAACLVVPAVRRAFGQWPATSDGVVRVLLGNAFLMNTVLSVLTTPSASAFLVWRVGPVALAVLESSRDVKAIQALSRAQVRLLCAAACLAPVLHQGGHALIRPVAT